MHDKLEKAREILAEVTPLKTDCGKVCGARCCRSLEGEETGMLLFPGEEAYYAGKPGWTLRRTASGTLLVCPGSCARDERPLACMPSAPTRGNPIQYPEVFERIRNRRLSILLREKEDPMITQDEAAEIFAHGADCLDPDLREQDDFTCSYPQTIPLVNERFGRYGARQCA